MRSGIRLVSFQFVGVDFAFFVVVVDVFGHLPNLHDVVLGHGADDPWFVGVP